MVKNLIIGEKYLSNNQIEVLNKIKKANSFKKDEIMTVMNMWVLLLMILSMVKANIAQKFQIIFMRDNLLKVYQKVIFYQRRLSKLIPSICEFQFKRWNWSSELKWKNFIKWRLFSWVWTIRRLQKYLCTNYFMKI